MYMSLDKIMPHFVSAKLVVISKNVPNIQKCQNMVKISSNIQIKLVPSLIYLS